MIWSFTLYPGGRSWPVRFIDKEFHRVGPRKRASILSEFVFPESDGPGSRRYRRSASSSNGGPCGKQPPEIEDGQRGIDGHVEDAGSQREPRLLVTPEGAEGSPHPDIEAALGGDGAGQLADHEGRGQTPHEWNDGEDQQRAEAPAPPTLSSMP
jgi:hypothetical protein